MDPIPPIEPPALPPIVPAPAAKRIEDERSRREREREQRRRRPRPTQMTPEGGEWPPDEGGDDGRPHIDVTA